MNLARRLVFMMVTGALLNSQALAQATKQASGHQLAIDVLTLKSGKSIRGAIVSVDTNGMVTMAVARDWLQHAHPDLYQKAVTREADLHSQVATQLQDRLKNQLETPPTEPRLAFFLKQELERAEAMLARQAPVAAPQFLWLDVEQEALARVTKAPADRQLVAMWAWSEHLANVETRDVTDLQRELKQRQIDPTSVPPDLSERLAPRLQDDREWAARMAIVEYAFARSVDFQGTGDVLVRTDADRKAIDLAPILSKVLKSQLDSFLKDLTGDGRPAATSTNDNHWLKSASSEADALNVHGLRATRVDVKVDASQASVQTVFAARMPKGDWQTVWSHRETQDATKPRADIEAKIASDPQVKQALDAVKSFGLGADDQVQKAIRFGAATMSAQQAADAKFIEFRDRYLKHLDRPPLTWAR